VRLVPQRTWRSVLAVGEANQRWGEEEARKRRACTKDLVDLATGRQVVLPAVMAFGGSHFIRQVVHCNLAIVVMHVNLAIVYCRAHMHTAVLQVVHCNLATPSPPPSFATGTAVGGIGLWHALERLNLRGCTGLNDAAVEALAAHCPQVQCITIHYTHTHRMYIALAATPQVYIHSTTIVYPQYYPY
jgi:hypothetical protein